MTKTYDKLSTKRLLTMSWLDGVPLSNFYNSSNNIKNKIAINLFKAWYLPFYKFGVIHEIGRAHV